MPGSDGKTSNGPLWYSVNIDLMHLVMFSTSIVLSENPSDKTLAEGKFYFYLNRMHIYIHGHKKLDTFFSLPFPYNLIYFNLHVN